MVSLAGYSIAEYLFYSGALYVLMLIVFLQVIVLLVLDAEKYKSIFSVSFICLLFVVWLMNFGDLRIAGVGLWLGVFSSILVFNVVEFISLYKSGRLTGKSEVGL